MNLTRLYCKDTLISNINNNKKLTRLDYYNSKIIITNELINKFSH